MIHSAVAKSCFLHEKQVSHGGAGGSRYAGLIQLGSRKASNCTERQLSVPQMGEERCLIIRMLCFYLSLYFTANKAGRCSFNNCCPAASLSVPGSRFNQNFMQTLFLSTWLNERSEIQLPGLTQPSKPHLEPESNRSTNSTKTKSHQLLQTLRARLGRENPYMLKQHR